MIVVGLQFGHDAAATVTQDGRIIPDFPCAPFI